MDKVIRDLASLHGLNERRMISGVAGDHLDAAIFHPWACKEFQWGSDQAPDFIALVQQADGKPATDVSGGAGNEDWSRFIDLFVRQYSRASKEASIESRYFIEVNYITWDLAANVCRGRGVRGS